MQKIHLFLMAAGLAIGIPAISGCPAGEGEGEGEAGEGEGEGEGAGEGEGEGSACNDQDVAVDTGGSTITLSDAELTLSTDGATDCPDGAGANICDTAGGDCYTFAATLDGATVAGADIESNNNGWVTWSNDGGDDAPFAEDFCNGGFVSCVDSGTDVICVCAMCIGTAPDNLGAAVHTATDDSNGLCVTID